MRTIVICALATTAAACAAPSGSVQDRPLANSSDNILPGGAHWDAEVPQGWNGTLLLYSRGYSPTPGVAAAAPAQYRQALLAAGYALAGSDYGAGGWALEQAVPAQRATVAAFARRYGTPRRVIGWGFSMGGLVTTALAEQRDPAIDGAVAMCASIGGAVGMMNMALDGAYAFRTLIAPNSDIRITGIDDDRANGARVAAALARAMETPEGRARVALAGVLAGIPGWTSADLPEPEADDYAARLQEIARAFVMGVFLPRVDQEARAGGRFSWNRGVDYTAQLERSGRRGMVAALYREAGADLDADLATLDAGQRITADPAAVRYMMAHYTPDARPTVPIAAVQMVGDGLTSPSMQRGYAEAAEGHGDMRSLWVHGAGHCRFDTATVLSAIRHVDARLSSGAWGERPAGFIVHTPPPMLRPCVRGGRCD